MIAIQNHKCCAGCVHWESGGEFHTGKRYFIESKGTCHAKKNPRKRWNYISAFNCKFYKPSIIRGFFMMGDEPLSEELLKEIFEGNEKATDF